MKHAKYKHVPHAFLFHIVFGTKNRVPLISETWEGELHKYFSGIIKKSLWGVNRDKWDARSYPFIRPARSERGFSRFYEGVESQLITLGKT